MFASAETQWRHNTMGEPTGLDYAALEPLARMTGITMTRETFLQVQTCEQAALAEIRRQSQLDAMQDQARRVAGERGAG